MKKYILLSSIIILIAYYISTFLISFTLLTKSIVNNDPVSLGNYINENELRNNFFEEINEFSSNLINLMDKKIEVKNETFEFTGELNPTFLEKLFSRMSKNISTDFSSPEIMLYFYFNSNEIATYLNKSFSHFGEYNFKTYLLNKQPESNEDAGIKEDEKETKTNKENEKLENSLFKLIQRINSRIGSTNYFFLVSPIHFKIDVKHQDIPFVIILKFNGYIWKIQKIKIPYKELINPNNINLNN